MPVSKYYGGHGEKVMAAMKKRHGAKTGERIFYATANKRGKRPHGSGTVTNEDLKRGYKHAG